MVAVPVVNLRAWGQTAAQRGWGAGWPSCAGVTQAGTALVTAPRSGTRMSWHRRIARLASMLIDETERRGFLLKPSQCGCYNCRAISGTRTPSNHSWAIAGDFNWIDNPFSTNPRHTIPDWMYALWAEFGFANGSMYSGARDWMHIEQMGTPAQVDIFTQIAEARFRGGIPLPPVPIVPPVPTAMTVWIQEADMPFPVLYFDDGRKGAPNGRGRHHWFVLRLQAMLNCQDAQLVPRCPQDGVFGQSTKDAVIALQKLRGLTPDGVVGPATMAWACGNDAPDFA